MNKLFELGQFWTLAHRIWRLYHFCINVLLPRGSHLINFQEVKVSGVNVEEQENE